MLSLRWNIKIAPQDPPGKKSSKSQLKRTASKIQGRKEEPEKVTLHYATTGSKPHSSLAICHFHIVSFPASGPASTIWNMTCHSSFPPVPYLCCRSLNLCVLTCKLHTQDSQLLQQKGMSCVPTNVTPNVTNMRAVGAWSKVGEQQATGEVSSYKLVAA